MRPEKLQRTPDGSRLRSLANISFNMSSYLHMYVYIHRRIYIYIYNITDRKRCRTGQLPGALTPCALAVSVKMLNSAPFEQLQFLGCCRSSY